MKKRKIGIVSLGYAWLPCEPGPSRFYYIARMFAENGYDVDLIGSSFQHFKKSPRERDVIRQQNYPFNTTFISVPPYKKNLDIRRIYSNKVAERRVIGYLETQEYDAIYCSIPANNIAARVGEYCRKKKIPFIVDIEDLWPEAMEMVFNIPVIRNLLFYPFKRDAERTYRNADAVIGTSDEYTRRAFKYNEREIENKTVYVGCDLEVFDQGVEIYSDEINKPENEFWVTYAGSLGKSYDVRTLILAAKELQTTGPYNIKIKILGTGPMKEKLELLARGNACENVEFLGYAAYGKMAAYLAKSDLTVNSFIKGAPQSIVNKVGDYLAAGKPMINTLESEEFCALVDKYRFGINIEPENVQALCRAVSELVRDGKRREELSFNARRLAEKQFDRKVSYKQIIRIVENV